MPNSTVDSVEADEDITASAVAEEVIAGKSPIRIALERLRSDKIFMVCATIFSLMVLACIFAPLICDALKITSDVNSPYRVDPVTATDAFNQPLPAYGPPNGPFTWAHPLGIAPNTAKDNLATLLFGMRNSLFIATIATVMTVVIGLAVGLAAGFSRGWVDTVLSFIIDLFFSFPFIIFALALAPIITERFKENAADLQRAQFIALIAILGTLSWMGLARLIRGQVMQLREREFVLAAQVIGASTNRILLKEMIPNLIATLVVVISISIPGFIAAEVGLSFLGLGLSGTESMGQMIQAAQQSWEVYPLYLWAPVTALVILVLCLNLMGDSIRDAFDPKTRR